MKNIYLLLTIVIFTTLIASCQADDTADIIINDNSIDNSSTTNNPNGGNTGNVVENIGGTKTADLVLEENTDYLLTEALIMTEGTTLTIPPGTIIRANLGADVYIAISQGAMINANGSESEPIVLTSNASTPNAGDWGGLILLGKAPINSVSGGTTTSTSEIAGLPYGGNISNDDSGVIRFVRVEYSGGSADASSENNGFSFYGIGNGTTVEYIQAFEGKDDGIEFFGGTVNARYISVVGAQDDSIDWTEGFTGTLENVYIEHGVNHDKGIEADGFNTDIGNNSNPLFFSKPTVNNVTILGRGSATENEAIRLRAGTQGIFRNIVLIGFEEGFDLDGDNGTSPTGQGVLDGDLNVVDITFVDVLIRMKNDTGFTFLETDFISGDNNGTGADYSTWGSSWTRN
jgi:hypothetical protein